MNPYIPMKRSLVILIALLPCFLVSYAQSDIQNGFYPGEVWTDTDGNPINAHGGGILFHKGIYYWYGEKKSGETWLPEVNLEWEGYRTDAGGVTCYSSGDLYHWKNEGVVLAPEINDRSHDLHTSKIIERPKVIFNESTGKFVMWMHIDSVDYNYARAGVAVSDSPTGPFEYLRSIRPNGQMSRDMTLFKDEDGRAYHVYSSEVNATLYISRLTEDYLEPSGIYTRQFEGRFREAPAVFRHGGRYYIVSSGCTGWSPNAAELAVADSMLGEWTILGNPCLGAGSEVTFASQSTFVLPVPGKENAFIFLADRWNKTDLEDSRYVWLPLRTIGGAVEIEWHDRWSLEDLDQRVNSIQEIIDDMALCHEALPHGVPEKYGWQKCPRVGMGNDPGGFSALMPWGQVYVSEAGNPVSNTRVELRNLESYYLSKRDRQWYRWSGDYSVDGAAYVEDFVDDIHIPADVRQEASGTVSVRTPEGYNYHFWSPSGRTSIDPEDIAGVFSTCQARLILHDPALPDDRDRSTYMLSVGADYWRDLDSEWDQWQTNGDIGIGRFKFIAPEWKAFNMHTLSEEDLRSFPPPLR